MRAKKLLAAAALSLAAGAAHAQQDLRTADEIVRGDTVLSRPRPDYDPVGIRLGSFFLYPDATLGETWNSNIYATPSGEKRDFITSVTPRLALKSNWNNHALNFAADSTVVRYARYHSESFTDYTVAADGRLDIRSDARLFAAGGYKIRHEPRSSPNNLGGTEPTKYQDTSALLAAEKDFNRLSFRLESAFDAYRYFDVLNASGQTIDESLRDRNDTVVTFRGGYELAPLRQVYALGAYNWRKYLSSTDMFGYDRTSDGYQLAIGAHYDLTGLVFADVFLGYRRQTYDDPRLRPVDGPTAGVKLTWNVTALTTLTGNLSREIEETVLANSSAYFATRASIRADHELLRDVLLNARIGYENDKFEGIGRKDNYYEAGLGATWLINRNFSLAGGYNYRTRDSNQPGTNFDENVVFVRLKAQL
ncbi:MAG: outer membrane beta-barrel protein [Ferrovibrionaceae bacterium]